MNWKAIRKDFTEPVKCEFCPRHITSGKAIVICNEYNQISFAGPNCGKDPKNIINPTEKIPDLTKGYLQESLKEKSSNNNSSQENRQNDSSDDIKQNIKAYLILRYEKLAHINKINSTQSAKKLLEIYNHFKEFDEIDEKHMPYMKTVMSNTKHPLYSYKNLQAIYVTDYWLSVFKKKKPNNDFINSVQSQLHRTLRLSSAQIKAINQIFKSSNGNLGRLSTTMFDSD